MMKLLCKYFVSLIIITAIIFSITGCAEKNNLNYSTTTNEGISDNFSTNQAVYNSYTGTNIITEYVPPTLDKEYCELANKKCREYIDSINIDKIEKMEITILDAIKRDTYSITDTTIIKDMVSILKKVKAEAYPFAPIGGEDHLIFFYIDGKATYFGDISYSVFVMPIPSSDGQIYKITNWDSIEPKFNKLIEKIEKTHKLESSSITNVFTHPSTIMLPSD